MNTCAYHYYKGAKKNTRCTTHTRGQYCHKHAGCAAVTGVDKSAAVANDPVFQAAAPAPKSDAGPEKLNSSVYAITINRNKTLDKMSEADKLQFKNFVDYLCDEGQGLYDFIEDSTADDPRSNIKELVVEHYFESGSKLGLVHAHAYLSIVHTGHMRLLIDDMRALAKKTFGENLHINVMASSNSEVAYRNYIRKGGAKIEL
jgi:hypothetical protein